MNGTWMIEMTTKSFVSRSSWAYKAALLHRIFRSFVFCCCCCSGEKKKKKNIKLHIRNKKEKQVTLRQLNFIEFRRCQLSGVNE